MGKIAAYDVIRQKPGIEIRYMRKKSIIPSETGTVNGISDPCRHEAGDFLTIHPGVRRMTDALMDKSISNTYSITYCLDI